MDISGAVVLVTGGQRGLGRAFTHEFLARGAAAVYATARTPVHESDDRIRPRPLDVTDDASVEALAAEAHDVDIVVNNAGVLFHGPLVGGDLDEARSTFETNVFGALRVATQFAPILGANGGGALVDVHSVLSWAAGAGAYGASKAALWSITNSLRLELAPQNTLVVGVHLGMADTDMVARIETTKLDPSDVARVVVDGVEQGEREVLVDEPSRRLKSALAGPVEKLLMGELSRG